MPGQEASLERLGLIFAQFDSIVLDAKDLMVEGQRAAAEVHIHCRHKQTGTPLNAIKANFWRLEAGWPISLTEYYDVAQFRAFMRDVKANAST